MKTRKSQQPVATTSQESLKIRKQRRIKERYGITLDDVIALYETQKGMCAICQRTLPFPPAKETQVDHAHDTATVRGILCFNCNIGLGYFKDNEILLERAMLYLHAGAKT